MKVKKLLAIILSVVMVIGLVPGAVFAASADGTGANAGHKVPIVGKLRQVNGDGTYTLGLSVTGDAEKKTPKVNVIVVFDTSSSMNTSTGNTEVTYTRTNTNGNNHLR